MDTSDIKDIAVSIRLEQFRSLLRTNAFFALYDDGRGLFSSDRFRGHLTQRSNLAPIEWRLRSRHENGAAEIPGIELILGSHIEKKRAGLMQHDSRPLDFVH
jgi:hypothetical protein